MGGIAKSVGSLFGIGQEGEHFQASNKNSGLDQMNRRGSAQGRSVFQDAIDSYASGGQSFEDALGKRQWEEGGDGTSALRDALATGATTGSKYASEQVRNDPMSKGLYGAGGLQDRLGAEEQELAGRGYGLQQQDHEAYGQASGNVARQFGQQENDLSKTLARRGLGSASSGAAGAGFSGLAGNKNEMLAKAQTDIAQKRMADTTQRLQSTRQMMGSLGAQGQQAVQSQFDRQLAGANAGQNERSAAAGLQTGQNTSTNNANLAAMEDKRGSRAKNIGDAWSEGTYSGTKSGTADATSSWMSMGGAGSMMSDENNKTNVGNGAAKARGFLDEMHGPADYSAAPKAKKSGGGGDFTQSMPWGKFLEQPNKDGTYTPNAGESARMERASSGLAPSQNGSGGMNAGGATENKGLTSLLGGMGGGSTGAGSGGSPELLSMLSDEACKQNVHGGGSEIRGFLDSVEPHSYEYKDEYKNGLGGPGEYVSPMAQELEQTELGADMVNDTPNGKVVDYGKGFGTLLAGMADVNKRLSAIEGRK